MEIHVRQGPVPEEVADGDGGAVILDSVKDVQAVLLLLQFLAQCPCRGWLCRSRCRCCGCRGGGCGSSCRGCCGGGRSAPWRGGGGEVK